MKKRFCCILFLTLIIISNIVLADVASPEIYPYTKNVVNTETDVTFYVVIAIIIVIASCLLSVWINKKYNKK